MKIHDMGVYEGKHYYAFHCPGCNISHAFTVPPWTFNGDFSKPTIRDSVKVEGPWHGAAEARPFPELCHSFVTDGKIQFLADSKHRLTGATVELPEWE